MFGLVLTVVSENEKNQVLKVNETGKISECDKGGKLDVTQETNSSVSKEEGTQTGIRHSLRNFPFALQCQSFSKCVFYTKVLVSLS